MVLLHADLKPGYHFCCLYETDDERRAILIPFLRQGLAQYEKVIYIVHSHTVESVLDQLRKQWMDIDSYLARGQLDIVTSASTYLRNGIFNPEAMIALIRAEIDRALAKGYVGLRAAGDMTWTLEKPQGFHRLIEYEAKANMLFSDSKITALCEYDRRRFSPLLLRNVLYTHPRVVLRSQIYENFCYLPPGEFLRDDFAATFLHHCIKNMRARNALQKEFCDLREQLKIVSQERILELRKVNEALQEEIAKRMRVEDELQKANQALRALHKRD